MYPHLRDTLYDLIRQLYENPIGAEKLCRRRLAYNAYYSFWAFTGMRLLFGSFAIKCNLSWYLKYDLSLGFIGNVSGYSPTILAILGLMTLFPIVVHRTVYYAPDPLIWSYMYDVLVRNVTQFTDDNGHLLLRWSWRELADSPCRMLLGNCRRLRDRLTGKGVIFSEPLKYYPHASTRLRSCLLFIGLPFEVQAKAFYLVLIVDFYNRHLSLFAYLSTDQFRFLLITIDTLTNYYFFLIFFQATMSNLNIISTKSLTCHAEYRHMRASLGSAAQWCHHRAVPGNRFFEVCILRQLHEYRCLHSRITLFLLRVNKHILAPNFLTFFACTLGTSTYIILRLIFQPVESLPYRSAFYAILGWQTFSCAIVLLVFLPINKSILSSTGPLYGVIKAMNATGIGAKSLGERWKLATYYELLHREEKQLALDAGMFGTLNSKKFIEILIIYLACYLTFASAFQNQHLK